MIYAIRAVGTQFIKFGRAKSVGKRLTELECGSPHELEILAVADWPDEAEKAIHLYLMPILHRREWFLEGNLSQEVLLWMVNGQAGLERLRAETLKEGSPRRVSLARACKSKDVDSVARRRLQRVEWWWRKRQVVITQPERGEPATIALHNEANA